MAKERLGMGWELVVAMGLLLGMTCTFLFRAPLGIPEVTVL